MLNTSSVNSANSIAEIGKSNNSGSSNLKKAKSPLVHSFSIKESSSVKRKDDSWIAPGGTDVLSGAKATTPSSARIAELKLGDEFEQKKKKFAALAVAGNAASSTPRAPRTDGAYHTPQSDRTPGPKTTPQTSWTDQTEAATSSTRIAELNLGDEFKEKKKIFEKLAAGIPSPPSSGAPSKLQLRGKVAQDKNIPGSSENTALVLKSEQCVHQLGVERGISNRSVSNRSDYSGISSATVSELLSTSLDTADDSKYTDGNSVDERSESSCNLETPRSSDFFVVDAENSDEQNFAGINFLHDEYLTISASESASENFNPHARGRDPVSGGIAVRGAASMDLQDSFIESALGGDSAKQKPPLPTKSMAIAQQPPFDWSSSRKLRNIRCNVSTDYFVSENDNKPSAICNGSSKVNSRSPSPSRAANMVGLVHTLSMEDCFSTSGTSIISDGSSSTRNNKGSKGLQMKSGSIETDVDDGFNELLLQNSDLAAMILESVRSASGDGSPSDGLALPIDRPLTDPSSAKSSHLLSKKIPCDEVEVENSPVGDDLVAMEAAQLRPTVSFKKRNSYLQFEKMSPEEIEDEDIQDFVYTEYKASRSCRRQTMTASFVICVVQCVMMVIMMADGGVVPTEENGTIGPPVYTMVKWGAKEAAFIVYRNEWWRLMSCLLLHAGLFHIIPNVAVQLKVCGYLNLVYGTPVFLTIYFGAGVFGSLCSCSMFPNDVSVGSSGAVLGELTSWVVWLLIRWNKIPPQYTHHRNCQMMGLLVMLTLVLCTSFAERVDWAAHVGGMVMGALMGAVLHCKYLEQALPRKIIGCVAGALICTLYTLALYNVADVINPTKANLSYWDANDDFN